MNLKPSYLLLLLFVLCANCADRQEGSSPVASATKPQAESPFFVDCWGDTISTGVPVPVVGRRVDPDSVPRPKTIPLQGEPKVVPAHINVFPAGRPKVVQIPEELTVVTPGKGGVPWPQEAPVRGKVALALQPPSIPALPPQIKDAAIADVRSLDVAQGMNSSGVYSILEDRRGSLWFGTNGSGASRYDGRYFTHYTKQEGLNSNFIRSILEDRRGNLWFATAGGGVSKYDGKNFTHFTTKEGLRHPGVKVLEEDSRGNIWFGTFVVGAVRYDPDAYYDQGAFTHFTTNEGLSNNYIRAILNDTNGNLWFGTEGGGVSKYDGTSFTHYTTEEGLSSNDILAILEDGKGNLWFGTQGGGVVKYDPDNGIFIHYTTKEGLSSNFIESILQDRQGNLWFGTQDRGVNKYDPDAYNGQGSFTHYSTREGFGDNFICSIFEDSRGNLWFGTSSGGVSEYNGTSFTHFTTNEGLSSNIIWSILEDSQGNLWFGTSGGGVSKYDGTSFTQYATEEGLGYSYNSIGSILEDSQGNLWFGTQGRGLSRYTPDAYNGQGAFTHYPGKNGLGGTEIWSILEDEKDRIWFATGDGATRYDPVSDGEGGSFTNFTLRPKKWSFFFAVLEDSQGDLWFGTRGSGAIRYHPTDDGEIGHFFYFTTEEGLSNNMVTSILEDSQGYLWFGTDGGGLNRYDGRDFTHYTADEGLSSNYIQSIIEDEQKRLWVSTSKGISLLVPIAEAGSVASNSKRSDYQCFTFGITDGLKNIDFQRNSAFLDRRNRIWWGSLGGLTMLDLNQFEVPANTPTVRLNTIDVAQAFVDYRRLSDTIYRRSLPFGEALAGSFDSVVAFYNYPAYLALPYQVDHLTFQFSAIDWAAPNQLQYSYLMEGLDEDWSPLSSESRADYRNLPQGTYTFKVKAIGAAHIWSDVFEYRFRIYPPWWFTWWAYLLYGLLAFFMLYFVYRFLLARKLEHAEVERLQELDAYKTRLYTNITHEFRTPLTIILGMARQIREDPKKWYQEGLQMITRHGRQLLDLVNQMLDLSKLDKGKLQLHLQRGEVIGFLHYLVQSFESFAAGKNIGLHFIKEVDAIEMDFDPDQLTKVASNLLSNAVKYTPEGGQVYVSVRKQGVQGKSTESLDQEETLELRVQDTGPGISDEELPRIFDRFYQIDDSATRKTAGTGIGLTLAKELVQLMGGKITVQSKVGEGTAFSVLLPIRRAVKGSPVVIPPPEIKKEVDAVTESGYGAYGQPISAAMGAPPDAGLPTVLLIEDNRDVLTYLASCLEEEYQLEFAMNGQEGIERALEVMPEIIISDVMMPEKDGYEVCVTLKEDVRTSHIPIILLTAKADRDARLEGLQAGADAYLSKPFDKEELDIRLHKLLELRRQLQAKYSQLKPIREDEERPLNKEERFLKNLRKTIEENLSDERFGISQLCREIGMSRSQLHKKIKALTGLPASLFIRAVRLEKAKALLEMTDMNISEVAYEAGFRTLAYFSKVFADEIGEAPSAFRKRKRDLNVRS